MNFNFKNTSNYGAIKKEGFFIFRFSEFFKSLFLALFIFSLLFFVYALLGFASEYQAVKFLVLSFSLYLLFWNLNLFKELKIKNPKVSEKISEVVVNPENYNLAQCFNLEASKIIYEAIKFCKRKKIALCADAVLYFGLKISKEIKLICFRLGIDTEKVFSDLRNYLEKAPRQESAENSQLLSEDFQETVKDALQYAVNRGHLTISEKDILSSLAKHDKFFTDLLLELDLKPEDTEDLTLWLDSAEQSLKRNKEFWSKENLARKGSFGKDWASGYTITLDQYSTDWREVVSKWIFREIVGHKKEIEETEMILARSGQSNALIVGELGVGKKSIIQALAQKCFLEASLPELNGKRVVELDLVTLAASIQNFEQLEAILDKMFSEALSAGNVILVIDDLENFVGQTTQKAGSVDISGILAKYLAIPHFQFVGISSYTGLHNNIEHNPSFAEFFRKVEVSEITKKETIQVLQNSALEAEHIHKVLILYPAVREIVNMTDRYMPSLPFPKKALDILDEVVVYAQTLKEKIITPQHVANIISKKTEIPVGKMESKEKEKLLNLESLIHQRIVNQAEAVNQVSIAMRRARAGIGSKKRPMGTFLFLGPTGVGKTETAKALAEIYFGSEENMVRLDMSEFQSVSDIPRLLGATSPVEMQGLLTTKVRETPFSLVLLDEIEKAYPDILNLLLQVLDEGYITDGQGRKVMFTNTIIICTSNAGAETIFKQAELGQDIDKDKLLEGLFGKGLFRPEFINRFDATVIFHPLTKENLLAISELMLKSLQKNLKEKEINFEITEPLKEKIVDLSYKPAYGAREMRRVIQDKVENVVAGALLSDKIKKGDTIQVDPQNFEIIVGSLSQA